MADRYRAAAWLAALVLLVSFSRPSTGVPAAATAIDREDSEALDVLISRATHRIDRGRLSAARRDLKNVLGRLGETPDTARRVRALILVSDAYLLARLTSEALEVAERANRLALRSGVSQLQANALNQLGNVLFATHRLEEAVRRYTSALQAASRAESPPLQSRIATNLVHASLARSSPSAALGYLKTASRLTRSIEDPSERLSELLAQGYLGLRLLALLPRQAAFLTEKVHTDLTAAARLAGLLGDERARSASAGHLGELYMSAQRYTEAERLLNRALFHAETADAPELAARWYWRLGRLQRSQGRTDEALQAYRQALERIRPLQAAMLFGRRGYPEDFRNTFGAIYRELAQILIDRAERGREPSLQQDSLRSARNVMEDLKALELKNHFLDYCVTERQEKNRTLELEALLNSHQATLYPVVFADRTVLLLSFASGELRHVSVPVGATDLKRNADELRVRMRPAGNPRRLLRSAQYLYDRLIRPLEPDLREHQIDTLVIVPDGALRTVPFSALHDGMDYLVSRYAVVVSPGLRLTDPVAFDKREQRILASGLSKGVQGFDSLPYVDREVRRISALYDGKQLLNEGFVKDKVIAEMERVPYTVVSFSTHGRIDGNPDKSFVLTYDDRLSLNELGDFVRISAFRDRPVDLLVLSACDTAVGDERAALGLAGIAVKSGARSAMASLWEVNDRSTAELVPAFLARLREPGLSKAKALQQAQQGLLNDPRTSHPYYWAPFIIVGNWM